MDPTARAIAQSYDEVPYESRPFPQTHPARSAALARLFGLTPPASESARILELGCAAGGNIIPLAASFPNATFLGVDLSPAQIGAGNARIQQLGLTNIDLRHQSITDLTQADGAFDYIICHGVYSWVPADVRSAILRVAHENLSPDGIAYISYNVHPGWRLRGVLREAMLFHIGGTTDAAERLAKARAFLNQLAEITDGATAYGQLLRQEAKAIAGHEDYYIAHEYLEHTNDPCYVSDFLADARNAGLAFLTEANFNVTIAETFGTDKGRQLRELSGNNLERMEQYIDFLTGRTFRQSLLVHAAKHDAIVRTLTPDRLDGLHIQSNLTLIPPADAVPNQQPFIFRDAAARTLTTPCAYVCASLDALGQAYPRTASIDDLIGTAPDETARATIRDALFKLVIAGMADLTTVPSTPLMTLDDCPNALPLARADIAAGRSWTTNARHEAIPLDVVQRALLPWLDGTHDTDALVAALRAKVAEGQIIFQKSGITLASDHDIANAARDHLAAALTKLTRSGLMVAA